MRRKLTSKERQGGSVGMPAYLKLQEFGSVVWGAFGTLPYQVGSSLSSKKWRDVDVRLILSDEEYETMFGDTLHQYDNEKWVAMVLAFSALGREMTGLPIDFQIQQQTAANAKYPGSRNALGFVPLRVRPKGGE